MNWASFDPFTIEDPYWQDKMGMPVANMEFLKAILTCGDFDNFRFFCADTAQSRSCSNKLQQLVPTAISKVDVLPQAVAPQDLRRQPTDVMHNGDFTHFMPYLIEWRNRLFADRPFPITGVTHSLDTVSLHSKFIQLLLANPKPYDAIICSSQCAVDMLRNSFAGIREVLECAYGANLPGPPQLVRIPLGIADREFVPCDKTGARRRLGIPGDCFVLLHLARFSPRRKMDLAPFLEAMAGLKGRTFAGRSLPAWQLVLAGAGKNDNLTLVQGMLSRLGLEHEVRIEPNVSRERKELLFQAADTFCSLVDNHQETFGLTLVEAMARGLPVIASDFDGYKELVSHGRTGFLIPTYQSARHEPWESLSGLLDPSILRFYRAQKISFDMDAFSDAVVRMVFRPELRQVMGRRARIRAEQYRWSYILKDYQQLWKSLAQEARKAGAENNVGANPQPLLTPSMNRSFSRFPSALITTESVLGLSTYASCLPKGFQPIRYDEMAILLRDDCLQFMLQSFQQGDRTAGAICCASSDQFQMDGNQSMVHLDWLMKHGLVAVKKL